MIKVLKECNSKTELITCEAGSEWWEKNRGNSYISPEVWNLLKNSDACFKGPTTTIPTPNAPRSVAVSIRQKFELYANVRPIMTYKHSPRKLNFLCVREATEGLYAGIEFKTSDESAIAIRKITKKGCDRIALKGFNIARSKGFHKIFAVTKRNILKETDGIFWEAVTNTNREFTEIEVEEYYIDNMTQQIVKNPERFNESVRNVHLDMLVLSVTFALGILVTILPCLNPHMAALRNMPIRTKSIPLLQSCLVLG
jgi:isocitrate dehydrogenase